MPCSGVDVAPDIVPLYNQFKLNKTTPNLICIVYHLHNIRSPDRNAKMEFQIKEKIPRDTAKKEEEQFKEIVERLTDDNGEKVPYFIVWDLKVPTKVVAGAEESKLIFMGLCLDDPLPVKCKMLFASSVETLTRNLEGLLAKVEVHDRGDMDYWKFVEKANQLKK